MKKAFITATILSLTLSACGTSPKTVTNNAAGVTYTFDGSDSQLKEVGSKAQSACERSGRIATLRNIDKTDDGKVANFDCNPRP